MDMHILVVISLILSSASGDDPCSSIGDDPCGGTQPLGHAVRRRNRESVNASRVYSTVLEAKPHSDELVRKYTNTSDPHVNNFKYSKFRPD